jgi:hypothetical protein
LKIPVETPLRSSVDVSWCPGSVHMFTPKSSALNRFIVAQLYHVRAFSLLLRHGTLENVEPLKESRGYEAIFSNWPPEQFDKVIERHGPISDFPDRFPEIASAYKEQQQNWASYEDWTHDVLLESESAANHFAAFDRPTLQTFHKEDADSVRTSGYRLESIANQETIFIVVGFGLWEEILDRPAAELLQAAIHALKKSRMQRAIILNYEAWKITEELHGNPVICIGGPNVNDLTRELQDPNRK